MPYISVPFKCFSVLGKVLLKITNPRTISETNSLGVERAKFVEISYKSAVIQVVLIDMGNNF